MKNIIRYTKDFVIQRFVLSRFHCHIFCFERCNLFFSHNNGDLCAHMKITCYNIFTCEDILFLCESSPGISLVYLNKMIFFLVFFFCSKTEIFRAKVVAHFHDQNTPVKLLDFHLISPRFIYYLTILGIFLVSNLQCIID